MVKGGKEAFGHLDVSGSLCCLGFHAHLPGVTKGAWQWSQRTGLGSPSATHWRPAAITKVAGTSASSSPSTDSASHWPESRERTHRKAGCRGGSKGGRCPRRLCSLCPVPPSLRRLTSHFQKGKHYLTSIKKVCPALQSIGNRSTKKHKDRNWDTESV